MVAIPSNHPFLKEIRIPAYLADSSAVTTAYVSAPFRCKIIKVEVVAGAAVDADRVITTAINGTSVTGGAVTLTASGSAAGDRTSVVPTAANVANEGDGISFASDGAGSTACPTHFFATIQPA